MTESVINIHAVDSFIIVFQLFASRRRVRLFLMEAEEEEEEEDEDDVSEREEAESITDRNSTVGDCINGDDDHDKENSFSVSVN